MELQSDVLIGALAAAGGGGIFYAIAKFFGARAIHKQDSHDDKINALEQKIALLDQRVLLKEGQMINEISDLKDDVFVAHERIRIMAGSNVQVAAIQGNKAERKKRNPVPDLEYKPRR